MAVQTLRRRSDAESPRKQSYRQEHLLGRYRHEQRAYFSKAKRSVWVNGAVEGYQGLVYTDTRFVNGEICGLDRSGELRPWRECDRGQSVIALIERLVLVSRQARVKSHETNIWYSN